MPDIRTRNQPADITVGLRVPHELPGGAAGLRDFVARVEATGIDRLFTGDHVTFSGGAVSTGCSTPPRSPWRPGG